MENKLSEIKDSKVSLCQTCGSKQYRTVEGYPKEEYGFIVVHEKNCPYIKTIMAEGLEV